MAQVTLPYTLTAGTPENVNNLVANLNALVAGVNTIDTAQIASSAVTTAKIADANVTADKLGSTLAGQLGVSQTSADRSVTVTQTAETTTTSSSFTTLVTSSELTAVSNGWIRLTMWGEAKMGAAGNVTFAFFVNNSGSYEEIGSLLDIGIKIDSFGYRVGVQPYVASTSYKKMTTTVLLPIISGNYESSTGKRQFSVCWKASSGQTAYVKNLTATMTYIAA